MTFLLDTNIVSELRKGRRMDPHLRAWDAATRDDGKYVSVLTLGEIRRGIERIRRRDARQARALDSWLRALVRGYQDHVPSTAASARNGGG